MKTGEPVVKQLFRLSVEPRVVDHLTKLAERSGEAKSRIATRLFTAAVLSTKAPARALKKQR